MPDIFTKDCKLKLIEYGTSSEDLSLKVLQTKIAEALAALLQK